MYAVAYSTENVNTSLRLLQLDILFCRNGMLSVTRDIERARLIYFKMSLAV